MIHSPLYIKNIQVKDKCINKEWYNDLWIKVAKLYNHYTNSINIIIGVLLKFALSIGYNYGQHNLMLLVSQKSTNRKAFSKKR